MLKFLKNKIYVFSRIQKWNEIYKNTKFTKLKLLKFVKKKVESYTLLFFLMAFRMYIVR